MDPNTSATPTKNRAKNRVAPKGFDLDHRKTPSFSSSSSKSSSSSSFYFPDDPSCQSPISPSTPLRLSGIPFSWEKLPGIPKRQSSGRRNSDASLKTFLPLPPSSATPKKPSTKTAERPQWDPFIAALVECSRDDKDQQHHDHEDRSGILWAGPKVSRSISDRFGFISLYGSCRRTCAVSESIVYLPGSGGRGSYDLVNNRRHHRPVDKLSLS